MINQRELLADFNALPEAEKQRIRQNDEQNRARREREAVQSMREKTVKNRIKFSGIPEEYKDAKLEECSLPIQQYFAALDVGVREDLLLRGDAGTGKTYAACAVAMAYVAKHTVRFVTMPYFLRAVNGTWISRAETPQEAFDRYAGADLLILDDLGKEVSKETSVAYIWELIDVRKSNGRPTIITSNYDSDDLFERLSKAGNGNDVLAIIDRIAQSNVIVMDGPSRREVCTTVGGAA